MKLEFFTGLDLGQSCDYTAMAVVERTEEPGQFDHVAFAARKIARLKLRHLERAPLGTPYPEVVSRGGDGDGDVGEDWAAPIVGGCDGRGATGGGLAAACEDEVPVAAGEDHGRGHGTAGGREFPRAEAGSDYWVASKFICGGVGDRERDGMEHGAVEADGGDEGEDEGAGSGAVRSLRGRGA